MDTTVKNVFSLLWRKYFNGAELPICFYYTNDGGITDKVKPGSVSRCLIGALSEVRKGRSLSLIKRQRRSFSIHRRRSLVNR